MIRYKLNGEVHLLIVFESHKSPPVLSLHSAHPTARANVPDPRALARGIRGERSAWKITEEKGDLLTIARGRNMALTAPRVCWERLADDIIAERVRAGKMERQIVDCAIPLEVPKPLSWHLGRTRRLT